MKYLLLVLLAFNIANASEKPVRVKADSGVKNYQAGIFTFEKGAHKVTFFSAIHIGQKSYYERLNKEFRKFDKVLFEKVKGYQESLLKSGLKEGPWDVIANKLRLHSQLKAIDYKAANFVNADLTLKELINKAAEKKVAQTEILNPHKVKQGGGHTTGCSINDNTISFFLSN